MLKASGCIDSLPLEDLQDALSGINYNYYDEPDHNFHTISITWQD